MTKGPIAKSLLLFAVPLILSGLLQQLYTIADAVIVGNLVGELPLAAIGATGTLSLAIVNIMLALTRGITILVSQLYGAGRREEIGKTAGTFATLLFAASVVLAALGAFFSAPLLRLLGTPADVFALAATYLRIVFAGVPFITLYNVYASLLRGLGDSRTPFYAIVVAAVGNIGLDLLFVGPLGMGLAGAAIATVLTQGLSCAYLVVAVRHSQPLLHFGARRFFSRAMLAKGLRLGLPLAAQSAVISLGGLFLQQVLNAFGTVVLTAITTAYRIDLLTLLPVINLSAAISTFTGQNIGAGQYGRVREGFLRGLALVAAVSVGITLVVVLGGASLMRLFGVSEQVVALGHSFFIMLGLFYPVFGLMNAFTGFLQGVGDVATPMWANIAGLLLRLVLSYALAGSVGFPIIAYAEAACWTLAALICGVRYCWLIKGGRWQRSVV